MHYYPHGVVRLSIRTLYSSITKHRRKVEFDGIEKIGPEKEIGGRRGRLEMRKVKK